MGLRSYIKRKFSDIVAGRPSTLTKEPEVVPKKIQRKARNFRIKQIGLDNFRRNTTYGERHDSANPEYMLSEAFVVADTEAIVARIFDRMQTLSWKEGWKLESINEEARKYIERRLYEMRILKWKSEETILKEAYRHLLITGNCFILKIRDEDKSSGIPHKLGGKMRKPIAALEVLDPTTMYAVRGLNQYTGKLGRIRAWRQEVDGETPKTYRLDDVIHITYNRKPSHIFGTPFTVPVYDDIRSLRRAEEYLDIAASKSAFPTFAYKVGTVDTGPDVFDNGYSEMDWADEQFANMVPEGMLIIPGHHSIDAIDISKSYIDIMPYIDYFRKRVVTGMGASLLDIGEGEMANRATGAVISQNIIDLMASVQDEFEQKISLELFQEILVEAPPRISKGRRVDKFQLTPSDQVLFVFNEIDQEAKRARENHGLNLVEKSVITMNEFRRMIGMKDLVEEDYEDMYFKRIQLPRAEAEMEKQTEQDIKLAKNNPRPTTGSSRRSTKKKVKNPNGTTGNKSQPSNQHGKSATKPSSKKRQDSICDFKLADMSAAPEEKEFSDSTHVRAATQKLLTTFDDLVDKITNRVLHRPDKINSEYLADLKSTVFHTMDRTAKRLADDSEKHLRASMDMGAKDYVEQSGGNYKSTRDLTSEARTAVEKAAGRLMGELWDRVERVLDSLDGEDPVARIRSIFDVHRYRIEFIARTEVNTARNFGYALTAKADGVKDLKWTRRGTCSQCNTKDSTLKTDNLVYSQVRAVVPNCGDQLKIGDN